MTNILIVEDDAPLSNGIVLTLQEIDRGFTQCFDISSAEMLLAKEHFDLILLDINLPDGSGLDLCRRIRAFSTVPILFLTANDTELDMVSGLETGGDDYITKPFSLAVLRARVNALLRRVSVPRAQTTIEIDSFAFDFEHMSFQKDNTPVELSKTEQKLLYLLIQHKGQTLTREKLSEHIWPDGRSYVDETKLWRFLSSGKLARSSIEKDRNKIKALISDISHQTKTPIANILMYTELLSEREDLPKSAKEITAQISPQAEKLGFLIQSLIKASRLESGIVSVHPEANPVIELVQSAMRECLPKAETKGVILTSEGSFSGTARFDLKWTAEALFNIIDNAVKYTPSGGQITVSAAEYEMFVRVDVRDTGIGIPEAELAKVFERFWRSPAISDIEGVGIGLYLARELISMQGGYIKAASVPGQGATFSIFLPAF